MGVIWCLFLIAIIFAIIYFAVRLAISPLLYKQESQTTDKCDSDLVKLRDMDILSNIELEEAMELYQKKSRLKNDNEQYQRYVKILNDLKEMEYFTDEQVCNRIEKLKAYFFIG